MKGSTPRIRPLTTRRELRACVEMQRAIWGEHFADVVPESILKVSQRVGGVVAGAFDETGAMLGFVFGLTGVERGRIVHWSDMLAVRPDARNSGLGRELKEYQRRVVRELGGAVIYWTFDPLVGRNAHINFNKLGGRAAEYVEDMYGQTGSVLQGDIPTDRVIVAWSTHDEEVRERLAESERARRSAACREAPVVTPEWAAVSRAAWPDCVRVEVPRDAESLLRDDPEEAAAWRQRVRCAMQWALGAGYDVAAFTFDDRAERGYYLMTKRSTESIPAVVRS